MPNSPSQPLEMRMLVNSAMKSGERIGVSVLFREFKSQDCMPIKPRRLVLGAVVSLRSRHDRKLHGEHIFPHPGRGNDFVTHGFNVLDLNVVHQVCCTMHFDDGFIFMDFVMAVLKVEGVGHVRTILDEYLAEWAFNEIVDMLGLWE